MRTFHPQDTAKLFGANGWFKASASEGNGTGCMEINFGNGGLVGLRDSKHPQGGSFVFSREEWRRFLDLCS